jgi:cellulose synthase/poly-beta-1,6-N-acetylglucosamine synthase-like glycosyltransferase
MIRLLDLSNQALFWYYLASNLSYLVMLVVALKTTAAHQRRLQSYRLDWFKASPLAPPITMIVPAHNEEKSIRVAVRNLLELDYPELEIIVVNDGSEDRTLDEMREEFRLRPARTVYIPEAKCAPVRGLYRSELDGRLLIIDKESGGSKADAVNAGLNSATSPYVCVVDADSVLERDALLRIMVPIMADPKRVVAVGGSSAS